MNSLATDLIEIGMLQFGWFRQADGSTSPVMAQLEMLASFPDVLTRAVSEIQARLDLSTYSRLLCTVDAIPLGTALSLSSGVPLVYSRGTRQAAADDLVGAYDGGHATLLVTNVIDADAALRPLIEKARRVGLDVKQWVGVLAIRQPALDGVKVMALLHLADLAQAGMTGGRLPPNHAQAVAQWLAQPN